MQNVDTLFDAVLARTKPIHFWYSNTNIETWSADELKAKISMISEKMYLKGVRENDRIAIILPTGIDLVATILAAWNCRSAFCIIPHIKQAGDFHLKKMNYIFELLQPKLIIHNQDFLEYDSASSIPQLHSDEFKEYGSFVHIVEKPQKNDIAIIQLTSGTTAFPKAVVLKHSQVLANVLDISNRAEINSNDVGVSWLPLYHDMGLSGLLVPVANNFPITLIPTELFVRNPSIWIEAMSQQKATLSKAPVFAYSLATKQLKRLQKQNIDLSAWRYAWIGAEPVYKKYLTDFQETMVQFGLRENVLQPAYGLAEAVVSVSSNYPNKPYRSLSIDAHVLHNENKVKEIFSDDVKAILLISNGFLMDGMSISIRREDGNIATEDEQGVIWISGSSVTEGYLGEIDGNNFENGWFNTGDIGFLYQGELYISGRKKDLIIKNGVNVSPSLVEMLVENYLNLRTGKVVAFSYQDAERDREVVVLVIVWKPDNSMMLDIKKQITCIIVKEINLQIDRIIFTESQHLPKTTSGKIQRSTVKELFLKNFFEG